VEGTAAKKTRLRKWLGRDHREMRAVSLSLLLVVSGVAILWAAKEIAGVEGSAVFVALLLIPLISYLMLSDRLRLKELRAAGIEAKFADVAESAVTPHSEPIPVEEMFVVEKADPADLKQVLDEYDSSEPIVMTVPIDGRHTYNRRALLEYLSTLGHLRTFKFVVFVDGDGVFVGYAPNWLVQGLLERGGLAKEFVRRLNSGRTKSLRAYPGIVSEAITTSHTNAHALREMDRLNLEALVVVNDEKRVAGIVERDQVLSKMLLALAP
jgi:CBS domain-containing protein